MAIHRVQTAVSTAGTGATLTATFGSSVTAGNLIVVGYRADTNGTLTVSDTFGSTYTLRTSDVSQNPSMYLYDAVLASSGSNTVSIANTASPSFGWVFAIEVTSNTASPFDVAHANPGAASTDNTSAATTTAQAIEYVVMFSSQPAFATYSAANDSAGHTWTLINGAFGGGGNNFGGVEEFITASAFASVTAHLTSTSGAAFTTVLAAYKDSGGGGGGFFGSPLPVIQAGRGNL